MKKKPINKTQVQNEPVQKIETLEESWRTIVNGIEETKQIQECLYNLLIMVEKEYKKKPIIYCNTRGYDLFIRNCDKLNHYGIWLDAKSDNSLIVPNTIIKQIKIENNIDINVCRNHF